MRLTDQQIQIISETVSRLAGTASRVFLFGSRIDDQAKGGDVDLLIETDRRLTLIDRAQVKMQLEASLGLPVDIVVQVTDASPTLFQSLARARAVCIGDCRAFQRYSDSDTPLYGVGKRLQRYCQEALGVMPQRGDFSEEFGDIVNGN